ncbi:hypothetical protein HNR46_001908 [Haloferula luteola]|uniref:Uncharacterized protein n=1 Tax=Haloferula luteola TaxID=595692 RepID=A0A840VCY6_9BACT|nr:hypothetical protein [Haloferula luteola]
MGMGRSGVTLDAIVLPSELHGGAELEIPNLEMDS